MRIITEKSSQGRRVLWFAAIYVASVTAFAIITGILSLLVQK
jgi:hypothetical protein